MPSPLVFDQPVKFSDELVVSGAELIKTKRFRVTAEMLDAAATAQTFAGAIVLPAGAIRMGTYTKVFEALAGGGAGSGVVDVGDQGGNTDLLVDAYDLFGATAGDFVRQAGDATPPVYPSAPLAADETIDITVTCDVDVELVTACEFEVLIDYYLKTDPYA